MVIIETPANFRELLTEDPSNVIDGARQFLELGGDWPMETRQTLQLVTAFGYDCDVRYFFHLISSRAFARPRKLNLGFIWYLEDVARLIMLLDDRRRWLPGFHANRKTQKEIGRDEAEAAKGMAFIEYLKTLSIDELRRRSTECNESPMRELLRHTLNMKESELANIAASN